MSIDLKVEGKKSVSEQTSEKYAQDEVLEQATQMDMEIPRAAEVNRESRDIATPPQEMLVQEAEKIAKNYPTDKQRATLEKARAAKAEKRKQRMLEGKKGAQGTPAPDLIVQVSELLNSKFESVNKVLDDIKKFIPYESPVQTNHETITVRTEPVELPSNPQLFQVQNVEPDNRVTSLLGSLTKRARSPTPERKANEEGAYPMYDHYGQKRMRSDLRKENKRFSNALSSVDFNNQEVMDRAKINFNEQGGLPPVRPAGFFF